MALGALVLVACSSDPEVPAPPVDDDPGTAPAPAPAPNPEPNPEPEPEPEPDPGGGNDLLACSYEDLSPVIDCAIDNCAGDFDIDPGSGGMPGDLGDFDMDEIGVCVASNCALEILGLPTECKECVLSLIDDGGGLDACTGDVGGLPGGGGGGGGLPF